MTTGSVSAIGPLALMSSVERRSTTLPVARSNSTHPDVSATIIPWRVVEGNLAHGACPPSRLDLERFLTSAVADAAG